MSFELKRPEAGTIAYTHQRGELTFPPEGDYHALDSLSRVQLQILGVHLSELQSAIRKRLYGPEGYPVSKLTPTRKEPSDELA